MLCVRGQAAADGCTYIIKNRDMGMPMEQALVRHIYPDGQEIIEVGGAGILTYPAVGINSHGLAVTRRTPPASTGWRRPISSSMCGSSSPPAGPPPKRWSSAAPPPV